MARSHARDCAHCAAALEAALELEAAMASAPAAPHGFTDRVMARVAETPQLSAREARHFGVTSLPIPAPVLPWWVRAMQQPATLLAAALAAVLVGWGDALFRGSNSAAAGFATFLATASAQVPAASLLADPRVALAMAIALTPSLLWASRRLYAWGLSLSLRLP